MRSRCSSLNCACGTADWEFVPGVDGPVLALAPPDDALLRAVLVKLFADRQLVVDESLIAYVAMRIERSFAAARDVVSLLDDEAMRQKRPITRALAAEFLRTA